MQQYQSEHRRNLDGGVSRAIMILKPSRGNPFMLRLREANRYSRIIVAILMGTSVLVWRMASPAPCIAESLGDAEKKQRVMTMYADYRTDFPGVEDIAAVEALKLVGDPTVVFVDVREPEEQALSMIPGAVTDEVFLADLDRFRGQRIIAYCTISYRSGKLADRLRRKNMTLINLEGGLLAWVHAGGPLLRGNRPVNQLHVYGRKWDLAPAAIETVF
jgi:sodium/bile acid cotransporter 7